MIATRLQISSLRGLAQSYMRERDEARAEVEQMKAEAADYTRMAEGVLTDLRAEIKRLRAAGDNLAEFLTDTLDRYDAEHGGDDVIIAWREARGPENKET